MGAVDVAIDLTRVHAEAKKVARAAAQAAYQASITAPLNARDEALAALVDVEGFPLSTVKEILGTKDHRTARGAVETVASCAPRRTSTHKPTHKARYKASGRLRLSQPRSSATGL